MMKSQKIKTQTKIFLLFFILVLFSFYCSTKSTQEPNGTPSTTVQIIILYTNDEHGWMEATATHGGAAGMMGLWRQNEGYTADGPYLILSGGDMWTGPAISTWFRGESMIDVMNAMGYHAAAIGNHEFDFQVTGLNERLAQADFPFLSANIRNKSDGQIPDFAAPYVIIEINGVKVGVIGLSAMNTPRTTFPDYVADFDFIDYDTALRETVPQAVNAGAELLIVAGHICRSAMQNLSATAAELGIAVIGGGHCHQTVNEVKDGVVLIEADSNFLKYARVEIMFDPATDTVESIDYTVPTNQGGTPDSEIQNLVTNWSILTNEQLSEVIGYVDQDIERDSPAMYNMITDSWLSAFPTADISISNKGGVRQSIPAGDITLASIVGVLPFENTIYQLELTGEQLISCLDPTLFVGGMTTVGGYFLADGTPIGNDTGYSVLITDFMYSSYGCFGSYEPALYKTGVHWRQPVIDWIKSLNTTPENPLDQYLDNVAR
ncbi:MAG: bifunctional metallophosphatase/5'-nucleotidase [bacterium]|nr:bifunctional metallophosphatase/5'-nucleotidase [bacterium]